MEVEVTLAEVGAKQVAPVAGQELMVPLAKDELPFE